MKTIITASILLVGVFLGSSIMAQNFAYVNSQALIESIPEVKEANANIETYRSQYQKRGQDMIKALQEKYANLVKKKERGEISPNELQIEEEKLKAEEAEIMKFDKEAQEQILQKSENLIKPLRDKIQSAIDEVASENGYDYIFDYSTGFVLYADSSTDVSELVRAKLGM